MAMGYKWREWTTKDYKEIEKLYKEGMSLAAIGRKFNVSAQTIANRLKELKVK